MAKLYEMCNDINSEDLLLDKEEMTTEEKEALLNSFYARNEEMKNGEWQKGWSDFCESVKEHYCYMIRNACNEDSDDTNRELFAHFLDCEAHTDVWRELFKTYNQTNEK